MEFYEGVNSDNELEAEMRRRELDLESFRGEEWRKQPPPKPVRADIDMKPDRPAPQAKSNGDLPAPQSTIGTCFSFERVRNMHCESNETYSMVDGSVESKYFAVWLDAALREAHILSETKPAPEHPCIRAFAEGSSIKVLTVNYHQLRQVRNPDLSFLEPPLNDPDYLPGVYETYVDSGELHCINPSGAHYKLVEQRMRPYSLKIVAKVNNVEDQWWCESSTEQKEYAARFTFKNLPSDYGEFDGTGHAKDYLKPVKEKSLVIKIEYGTFASEFIALSDEDDFDQPIIYVAKRDVVDHLSKDTSWIAEKKAFPTTDRAALEILHSVAGKEWESVNETLYVYEDGIWTQEQSAFCGLMMRHSEKLGPIYGESVRKIRDVAYAARTMNKVDATWTQKFNRLDPGLVPFSDGIFDVESGELRDFEHEDMLTCKFDFASPKQGESFGAEKETLEKMLLDLLPDPMLKREVMTRLAESFFNCSNKHEYFVQLYGEGNNGKTTRMRMLQTAFPLWVQMPNVEHLVARGGSRNADAPQPWLVDVMCARILGFEEPPVGAKFDGSFLKLLRGNGVVTGRALYKGNVSYVPSFTLYIAANSPIDIAPTDQAVLNSFHSFEMPSCFVDKGCAAPLGTRFVKQKIPNIEERFNRRPYKLALFDVLSEYYFDYLKGGLPDLMSPFSKKLTAIYKEEHPAIREIFDSCVAEDKASKVSGKRILAVMQQHGYEDNPKKLKLFMESKYEGHNFVRKTRSQNLVTWNGLCVVSEDD